MAQQELRSWWVITRKYHPPKEYPPAETVYVMGDDGPLLFDRQMDAGRHRSAYRLPRSQWELLEVYKGDDGELHWAVPGWQRRLRQRT